MRKLSKTKQEFYTALRAMLGLFHDHVTYLKSDKKKAIEATIDSYDDFYDWLQRDETIKKMP